MVLPVADIFYNGGTMQDQSRKHAVQHRWLTAPLGNQSAKTECAVLLSSAEVVSIQMLSQNWGS